MNHSLSLFPFTDWPLESKSPLVTQAFPIALFEHPLLLALRVFHVLFGTDRKPFHCFTTWILALMKEAFHQIIGHCRELVSSVSPPASMRPRHLVTPTHSPQGTLGQLRDTGFRG